MTYVTESSRMCAVAVVIPVFNRNCSVLRAIESVKKQTFAGYNITVVDDGSTDGSAEAIRIKHPDVGLIRCKVNRGAAAARNVGIRSTASEYVAFLDSDDVWLPEFLAEQVARLLKNTRAVMSVCDFWYCDSNGRHVFRSQPDYSFRDDIENMMLKSFIATMSSVVVRRSALEQAGLLNEALKVVHDRELYLRLLREGTVATVRKPMVERFVGRDSLVHDLPGIYRDRVRLRRIFCSEKRNATYKSLCMTQPVRDCVEMAQLAYESSSLILAATFYLMGSMYALMRRDVGLCLRLVRSSYWQLVAATRVSHTVGSRGRIVAAQEELSDAHAEAGPSRSNRRVPECPTSLVLFVTNRCNMRCRHCFYWKNLDAQGEELSVDRVARIARSVPPGAFFCLTGGEMLLRDDALDLVKVLDRGNSPSSVNIMTNGLNRERVVACLEALAKEVKIPKIGVQISLDGMPQTHDSIRGVRGAFDAAVCTMKSLLMLRQKYPAVQPAFFTVLMRGNAPDIGELITFTAQFRAVHGLSFERHEGCVFGLSRDVVMDIGVRDGEAGYSDLSEMEQLLAHITKQVDAYGYSHVPEETLAKCAVQIEVLRRRRRIVPCLAGATDAVIYPNGDIAVCEMCRPFANLSTFEFDVRRAWHSREADAARAATSQCACIHGCALVSGLRYERKRERDW